VKGGVRQRWTRLAVVAGGLAVAAFLALRLVADWRDLPVAALRAFHLDPRPLALAWLLQTAGWLVVVDAWRRILARVGGWRVGADPVPFARHLQLHAYVSLTAVLPGSVWQPASRIALYRARGVPGATVSAAIVVEWLLLGLAGLALYGASAPFAGALPPDWAPWLVLVAVAAIVLLHPAAFGALMRRAAGWLGRGDLPPRGLAARDLTGGFGRELAVLSLSGVALYLLMRAISPAASLPDALSAWGLTVAVASLLAWLPATALLKDGGMVLLLTPLFREVYPDTGSAALAALAVTLAWRIWSLLVLASWAVLGTWAARAAPGKETAAS